MANNQYLTAFEVISKVFLINDGDSLDSRNEGVYQEWIWDALRQIGSNNTQLVTQVLEVTDNSFDKPCDMWYPYDLNLLSCDGKGYVDFEFSQNGWMCSNQKDYDYPFFYLDFIGKSSSKIVVSEGRDCFNISTNADWVSHVELKYYRFNLDADGNLLIPEQHFEAVQAYLEYMSARRQRNTDRTSIPMSEIQFLQMNWRNELTAAKGRNAMPNNLEAESIARRWVSMLPNFKTKKRKQGYGGSLRGSNILRY